MPDQRFSGLALIAGAIASIITMAFHPTGQQLLAPGALHKTTQLAVAVHTLALLSLPVLFIGAVGLSRRLLPASTLSLSALVLYGFATVAVMNAAVLSGFVAPTAARRIAEGESADLWQGLFYFTGVMNQSFALIFVAASSTAILLWSIAVLKTTFPARGIAIYGCVVAPLTILLVVVGHIRLDVHGFGLIMLAQAIWLIAAGVQLVRSNQPTS